MQIEDSKLPSCQLYEMTLVLLGVFTVLLKRREEFFQVHNKGTPVPFPLACVAWP